MTASSSGRKRKPFRFILYYTKNRRGDRVLNRVFIGVTALITAFGILSVNFGDKAAEQQSELINAISDRSIFVVNDTAGWRSNIDYEEALAMSPEEIEKISSIPNISKVYPYYNFSSYGYSGKGKDNEDSARIKILDGEKVMLDKVYENTIMASSDKEQFIVSARYPEEDLSYLLEYKSESETPDGIILNSSLALKFSKNPAELVGKRIEVFSFVPAKLFASAVESKGKRKITDGTYSKFVKIEGTITGILSGIYNIQRAYVKDEMFLNYEQFQEILDKNKDVNYKKDGRFPEKELGPSALVIFANSYEDVPTVLNKVVTISTAFETASDSADVKGIQNALATTKTLMTTVTIVFIGVIVIMFGMLYHLKSRSRKREIGILKAIGFTKTNILQLTSFEMLKMALMSFAFSLILALVLAFIGNSFLSITGDVFLITPLSVTVGFFISIIIVLISGIFPIYKASRIDPIEAIRKIDK